MAGLEPGRAVTDGEVDRVETLSDELRRFGEDVEAGPGVSAAEARRAYPSRQTVQLEGSISVIVQPTRPCAAPRAYEYGLLRAGARVRDYRHTRRTRPDRPR